MSTIFRKPHIKGSNIIFRLLVVVVFLSSILAFKVMPASADSASIDQKRYPSPGDYRVNTGNQKEYVWWKIVGISTSTPVMVSHSLVDPDGNVFHTENWDVRGLSFPLYNPENTAVNQDAAHGDQTQGDTYSHVWTIPAGAKPGVYYSRVRYYSKEVSGSLTYPPLNLNLFDSSSETTFLVKQPLQIFKYNDLNGNGQYDPGSGETGLENWHFEVTGPNGYTFSGNTDAFGYLDLGFLEDAGSYSFTETLKSGWRNTSPGGVSPYTKTVIVPTNIDETDPTVKFGNQQLGSLKIFKFSDKLSDGIYNGTDTPLQSWDFSIDCTDPVYHNTGTTNANGEINISDLLPGNYVVTETLKNGWTSTTGGLTQTKSVTAGNTQNYNFGNHHDMGSLLIFKFLDVKGDKSYTPADGDVPLSNWTFEIAGPNGYIQYGITDLNGHITKDNLEPGSYTVTESVPTGWLCTTTNPLTLAVTVNNVTEFDFGNQEIPHQVPASSNTTLVILLVGFGLAIGMLAFWRTRRSTR